MRVRNVVTDQVFEAEWRRDHPASSYGQPVLVLKNDQAVDALWFVEIVEEEGELGRPLRIIERALIPPYD